MRSLKRLSMLLVLLLSVVAVYAGGIGDVKELIAFAKAVNSGASLAEWQDDKGVVCLECDIDMKKAKKLPVILAFNGVLDGKGYALKNWKTTNALIHELKSGGEVRNLRIDGSCSMKLAGTTEELVRGFIVNINSGTLRNCCNDGSIVYRSSVAGEAFTFIGGLCGINRYVVIDSKNTGDIAASAVVASASKKPGICVGGIAGSSRKNLKSASYIRCENGGEISLVSDLQHNFVGGIAGQSVRASVKMCVNRGKVSAKSERASEKVAGKLYMGGIAGHCNSDIMCCDNFGEVNALGVCQVRMAGVVGMPNAKMNIIGSNNYGKVISTVEGMSLIGGIVGTMALETHICNSNNHGEVLFAGVSPKASYVGGVVGSVGSVKKATHGAHIRLCNNYGSVVSGQDNGAEGNNSIHTAGVAGHSLGTEAAPITFTDCANMGTVKAVGGRKADIVAYSTNTKVVGGHFHNNYAEKAEPTAGGATIYGRVTSTTGEPLQGVVVSDGNNCVQSDKDGRYALKSDMALTNFVHISVPDGYKVPFRNGVPQIFRRVPRHAKGVVANFVLEKREQKLDNYLVAMIGDPQMRGFNHDTSSEKFRDVILPDVVEFAKKEGKPIFTINLGDLCYNWMPAYDDYLDIVAGSGLEMFHVIGNHDFDQATILETKLGTPFFEEYIMPTNYSFTIGKIHYVMVNDINYARANAKKRYSYGLHDREVEWLERDLSFVPKDYSIVICAHSHLHRNVGKILNYKRYSAALAKFKRVYSWSGHYHNNFGADFEGEVKNNLGNVVAVAVARCSGNLRANRDLGIDGTPNGYVVVEVNGENLEWYYKALGRERDYQIRAYSPTRTGDGYVKACIWNHTPNFWSQPEWWENGKKVANLEQHKEADLDAIEINKAAAHLVAKADPSVTWTSSKGKVHDYTKPNKSRYMFRVKPSEGVRSGEIRVKDNFGKEYTCKVEW